MLTVSICVFNMTIFKHMMLCILLPLPSEDSTNRNEPGSVGKKKCPSSSVKSKQSQSNNVDRYVDSEKTYSEVYEPQLQNISLLHDISNIARVHEQKCPSDITVKSDTKKGQNMVSEKMEFRSSWSSDVDIETVTQGNDESSKVDLHADEPLMVSRERVSSVKEISIPHAQNSVALDNGKNNLPITYSSRQDKTHFSDNCLSQIFSKVNIRKHKETTAESKSNNVRSVVSNTSADRQELADPLASNDCQDEEVENNISSNTQTVDQNNLFESVFSTVKPTVTFPEAGIGSSTDIAQCKTESQKKDPAESVSTDSIKMIPSPNKRLEGNVSEDSNSADDGCPKSKGSAKKHVLLASVLSVARDIDILISKYSEQIKAKEKEALTTELVCHSKTCPDKTYSYSNVTQNKEPKQNDNYSHEKVLFSSLVQNSPDKMPESCVKLDIPSLPAKSVPNIFPRSSVPKIPCVQTSVQPVAYSKTKSPSIQNIPGISVVPPDVLSAKRARLSAEKFFVPKTSGVCASNLKKVPLSQLSPLKTSTSSTWSSPSISNKGSKIDIPKEDHSKCATTLSMDLLINQSPFHSQYFSCSLKKDPSRKAVEMHNDSENILQKNTSEEADKSVYATVNSVSTTHIGEDHHSDSSKIVQLMVDDIKGTNRQGNDLSLQREQEQKLDNVALNGPPRKRQIHTDNDEVPAGHSSPAVAVAYPRKILSHCHLKSSKEGLSSVKSSTATDTMHLKPLSSPDSKAAFVTWPQMVKHDTSSSFTEAQMSSFKKMFAKTSTSKPVTYTQASVTYPQSVDAVKPSSEHSRCNSFNESQWSSSRKMLEKVSVSNPVIPTSVSVNCIQTEMASRQISAETVKHSSEHKNIHSAKTVLSEIKSDSHKPYTNMPYQSFYNLFPEQSYSPMSFVEEERFNSLDSAWDPDAPEPLTDITESVHKAEKKQYLSVLQKRKIMFDKPSTHSECSFTEDTAESKLSASQNESKQVTVLSTASTAKDSSEPSESRSKSKSTVNSGLKSSEVGSQTKNSTTHLESSALTSLSAVPAVHLELKKTDLKLDAKLSAVHSGTKQTGFEQESNKSETCLGTGNSDLEIEIKDCRVYLGSKRLDPVLEAKYLGKLSGVKNVCSKIKAKESAIKNSNHELELQHASKQCGSEDSDVSLKSVCTNGNRSEDKKRAAQLLSGIDASGSAPTRTSGANKTKSSKHVTHFHGEGMFNIV